MRYEKDGTSTPTVRKALGTLCFLVFARFGGWTTDRVPAVDYCDGFPDRHAQARLEACIVFLHIVHNRSVVKIGGCKGQVKPCMLFPT